MEMDFLSKLLENLALEFLPVLAVFVVAYAVRAASQVWGEFKRNEPDKAWLIEKGAAMAVRAAEQAGIGELATSKKQYAVQFVQDFLKANGIKVNINLISAAVEAAVFEQFNKDRVYKQPVDETGRE